MRGLSPAYQSELCLDFAARFWKTSEANLALLRSEHPSARIRQVVGFNACLRDQNYLPYPSIRSFGTIKTDLTLDYTHGAVASESRAGRQLTRILILAIIRRVLLRAIAVQSGRVNGFPSFAQDEE